MGCFWRGCRQVRFGVAVMCLLAWAAEAQGQTEPAILHEALECIQQDRFPVVDAAIEPGAELRTAKVYFRSEQFPDFYYVEMGVVGGRFVGVLPKPAPETRRVFYYIEAVDFAFNGSRNEEHDPEVRERCKRRDGAAYVPGEDPAIVVGATKTGASAIPPGFQAAGVAGFITAAGISSGVGGGVGVGTAVVVGAAAAGGVAGAVVVTNSEGGEAPTTTVPSGGPAPATTTVSSGGGTTTIGPTTTSVPSGSTTSSTPGGTTTTTTPGGSTTTTPGGTTTTTAGSTTTTTIGSSTTTTTSSTTTTTAPAAVSACFTATLVPSCGCSNDCKVRFDASCSTGSISRYDWVLDTGDVHQTVVTSTAGPILVYDWSPGDCEGETHLDKLTVVGSGTDSITLPFTFPSYLRTLPNPAGLQTSFQSLLSVGPRDGTVGGHVLMNNTSRDIVDNSGPFLHRLQGAEGNNTVDAHTTAAVEGFWRFDFSGAEHFEPGSLKAEAGHVVSVDGHSIVFRLSGTQGQRLKFTYRLSR